MPNPDYREEVLDQILADYPEVVVTKNEVPIPGYLQAGAQFASAWLAGRPEGSANLAVWGCWDDPALGAISTLKQQNRPDVKVYGTNGNVDAIVAVQDGWMTATAWAAVEEEGRVIVETLVEAMQAGDAWEPKAVEVPVIVVNKDTITDFLAEHPEAIDSTSIYRHWRLYEASSGCPLSTLALVRPAPKRLSSASGSKRVRSIHPFAT